MPSAKKVEITDAELGKALRKKGLSLDKYVETRQRFAVSPTRARAIASSSRLSIDTYADALEQGFDHRQIIRLAEGRFNLQIVLEIMKRGKATLEEALEACEAGVPMLGSYSYPNLRGERFNISHQEIIAGIKKATAVQANKENFLAFLYDYRLDEGQALAAAKAWVHPPEYVYALRTLGMSHEEIMERCKSYGDTQEFERDMYAASIVASRRKTASLCRT